MLPSTTCMRATMLSTHMSVPLSHFELLMLGGRIAAVGVLRDELPGE